MHRFVSIREEVVKPQSRNPAGTSAVVIGGAGGIGAAVVRRLSSTGAHVHIVDTNGGGAQRLAEDLGEHVSAFEADVLDEMAVREIHRVVAADYAPVTGLVNCAGARPRRAAIEDYGVDEWERSLLSHLRSTYVACRVFGAEMAERGDGSIVNIASVLALRSGPVLDYGPAKAGVVSLTESLAVHWATRGVRVNAVAPGWTDTSFLRPAANEPPRDFQSILNAVPQQRLMRPEEIAEVVTFLLSPAASGMTGVTVACDGGYLAGTGWQPYR